ncbi:ArsR family transcriptional regulator [Campylobacter sp. MIT 99-7217]|uniref:replication/maintenance protein RepL n=1 Tax=Campylobacter sp. MIT 99-7217 TaxID=535091 RepID=UPI00115B4558|nr:replication/maintenance protein RepL [Campylobacter sp. MIT 99-7217]TQR32466.1 ArsR family transcriptional regulator [Campylobacter sp. MIT 99-7217]
MDKFDFLCEQIFGKKKFEIFKFLCEKADENGFIFVKIDELMKELNTSKPTIIASFKFLEEKKLFKRLKNGLYKLKVKDENED